VIAEASTTITYHVFTEEFNPPRKREDIKKTKKKVRQVRLEISQTFGKCLKVYSNNNPQTTARRVIIEPLINEKKTKYRIENVRESGMADKIRVTISFASLAVLSCEFR
jgi:predicted HTH transcriptional regulator